MQKQIVLVDAKNLLYRCHYAHVALATKGGKPTSVLFGMLDSLLSMAKKFPQARWCFVWDGAGRTWRHELLDQPLEKLETGIRCETPNSRESDKKFEKSSHVGNKANVRGDWFGQQLQDANAFLSSMMRPPNPTTKRLPPEPPGALKPEKKWGYKANRDEMRGRDEHQIALAQVPEIKLCLRQLGFKQFEVPNLEGDDLMGILVEQLRGDFDDIIIQSGDRDFYQFIGENVRQMKRIFEGKAVWADQEEIFQEFRVDVKDWVKLKALLGDTTDNIPHLFEGVGKVTAASWINNGLDPSLETFESHSDSVQVQFTNIVVRKNAISMRDRWPEVYRNYRLSKILTSVHAPEIRDCKKELLTQFAFGLGYQCFARRPVDGWMTWLSSWLVKWEMEALYGAREEFRRIP